MVSRKFKRSRVPLRRRHRVVRKSRLNSRMKVTQEMVSYMPRRMHTPIPPRYRTKFHCDAQLGILQAAAISSGIFPVSLNAIHIPFNNSGITPGANFIFGPQLPTTLQPTGYSQICNATFYTKYRVISSKLTLKVVPSAQADTLMVTITPSNLTTVPTTSALALSQPYCKSKLFQSNQPGSLSNSIAQHTFIGCSKKALDNDLSGQFVAPFNGLPIQASYWIVNFSTVDGLNTTTPVIFNFRLSYDVELWGNESANLIST